MIHTWHARIRPGLFGLYEVCAIRDDGHHWTDLSYALTHRGAQRLAARLIAREQHREANTTYYRPPTGDSHTR